MSADDMIKRGDALAIARRYLYRHDDTIQREIAALPAVTPKVRPLVWQFEQEDVQVANTSARHQYRIVFDRRATVGAWMWFCDGRWICCETEDAAKAAAQADFDARTLAELDLKPAPDAAAIREAAMREAIDRLSDDGEFEAVKTILALLPKGGD